MKRILSLLLMVCLAITGSNTVVLAENHEKEVVKNIQGIVNMDLPYEGSEELKETEKAKLDVYTFEVDDTRDFLFEGNVEYNNESYTFGIDGKFYNAMTDKDKLVGANMSSSGDFEIINIEMIKSVKDSELRYKWNLSKKSILVLRLMRIDTREFVTFEIELKDILRKSDKLNFSHIENNESIENEHWWIKVFTPEESLELKEANIMTQSINEDVHEDIHTKTITYEDGPGNSYKYTMDLKLWTNTRDYGNSNKTMDTYQLDVVDTDYFYNDVSYGGEFLVLYGCVASAVLQGATNADTIGQASWSYEATKTTGGLQLNTHLEIGLQAGGVGGSISWKPLKEVTKYGAYKNFSYSDQVRGIKWPFEQQIKSKGNFLALTIMKDKGTGSNKYSGAVFSFDIGFDSTYAFEHGTLIVGNHYN